jgi:hypothetical protein
MVGAPARSPLVRSVVLQGCNRWDVLSERRFFEGIDWVAFRPSSTSFPNMAVQGNHIKHEMWQAVSASPGTTQAPLGHMTCTPLSQLVEWMDSWITWWGSYYHETFCYEQWYSYLFMRAIMGHQMADFWIWVDKFSGVILPNIDWHIYTSQGISGHLFIWHYCCFCVFWIGVVDCYRSLHPFFFRVPHLKCKIGSDQNGLLPLLV